MLTLYRAIGTLAEPALRLHLARRAARGRELFPRLPERRGSDPTPRPPGKLLWLHAASVGESLSLLPVLDALRAAAPAVSVLITTGTVTSARLLAERAPHLTHRFVPLDVPRWVGRFLDHWRPDAAAFVESELWPTILTELSARKIPAVLLNARLSPRSAARWALLPGVARAMLGGFSDILAQSPGDAARIGRFAARVASPGNLKFAAGALPADPAALAALDAALAGRPAWVAALIHPAEDRIFAAVHARLAAARPDIVTILLPRHPDRGAAMAAALGAGLRSRGDLPRGLYVADILGEPGLFYRAAPVVVMGKSFAPAGGGQNPLEPARLGAAVGIGPRHANFDAIVPVLRDAGALTVLSGADGIGGFVDAALTPAPSRERERGQDLLPPLPRAGEGWGEGVGPILKSMGDAAVAASLAALLRALNP